MIARLALIALPVILSGCIARTAVGVVTAPVRAVGQVADWATTSQDEADRNRGRAMREREEQLGRLDRQRARAVERCRGANEEACARAEQLDGEIAALRDQPLP